MKQPIEKQPFSKAFLKASVATLGVLALSFNLVNAAEAKKTSPPRPASSMQNDDLRFHEGMYVPEKNTLTSPVEPDDLRFHEGSFVPGKSNVVIPKIIAPPPITGAIIRPKLKTNRNRLSLPEAIEKASLAIGIDKNFLRDLAMAESSGNPKAISSSKTSSAQGAYGFTNQTWLITLKKFGAQLGYANAAEKIVVTKGKYHVPNKKDRAHILKTLRHDPLCSSLMSAAHSKENYETLNAQLALDHKINGTELYTAHFLGPNGAVKFFNAKSYNPFQSMADLFPQAAKEKGNKPLIYKKDGSPKLLVHFYDAMTKKVPPRPVRMLKPRRP